MTDKPLSGKIRGEINGGGFSWGVWGQARPDIMGGGEELTEYYIIVPNSRLIIN